MGAIGFVGAIAALVCVSGGAMARCPEGREDAARGIVMTLGDGILVTDRVGADGLVKSVQRIEGSDATDSLTSLYGILPIGTTYRESDAPDAYVSALEVRWEGPAMPEPVAGMVWRGTGEQLVRETGAAEASLGMLAVEVRVTGATEVVIGPCRYDALTVELRMDESASGPATEQEAHYLPALGIGLMRRSRTVTVGEPPGAWYDWPEVSLIEVAES